jgi:hypothetical protein
MFRVAAILLRIICAGTYAHMYQNEKYNTRKTACQEDTVVASTFTGLSTDMSLRECGLTHKRRTLMSSSRADTKTASRSCRGFTLLSTEFPVINKAVKLP